MKSRATGKREVTRHVISCELLLNEGSLSFGFNCLIVKALIYFLTKKEMNSYTETLSYFPTIKPKNLTRLAKEVYPFSEQKKIPEINRSLFSKTTTLADNRPRFSLFRMIAFRTTEDQIQKCVRTPVAFQANTPTF